MDKADPGAASYAESYHQGFGRFANSKVYQCYDVKVLSQSQCWRFENSTLKEGKT